MMTYNGLTDLRVGNYAVIIEAPETPEEVEDAEAHGVRVIITDAEQGIWAGDGRWPLQGGYPDPQGSIDDCAADLGDQAYEELDAAIRGALAAP